MFSPIRNPKRSRTFRLVTIAASGLCSLVLAAAALRYSFGADTAVLPAEPVGIIIISLSALAAALAALSFYAGVDESAAYVFHETQIDKLTGLYARTAMIDRVAEAAEETAATGKSIYLLDIDIDRFKQINEAIGYAAGDKLIHSLARRIEDAMPKGAVVGRLGAGEFAVLVTESEMRQRLEPFIQSLIEKLMQPYRLPTHMQSINLSIGVVEIPTDGTDPALLLRRSNLALRHARATGVGTWATFHPDMGRVADHRRWIEAELNTAFERGDFHLHYQPQLDLGTARVVGYEALIRWKHPERGMIPPNEFISVAEETGMIAPLGNWVLRTACEDAVRLLPEDCFVAVNISPVQFMTRDFVGTVKATIEAAGLAPSRLELEVTESARMQDRDRAADILKQLTGVGISVAVDDFGTGYSNLSFLIDFSFQKLKIDRSFVSRMETDTSSGAVISSIVDLSRALGVDTIAEGVETESQAALLREAGCRVVQGYLFGRPAPLPASETTGVGPASTVH